MRCSRAVPCSGQRGSNRPHDPVSGAGRGSRVARARESDRRGWPVLTLGRALAQRSLRQGERRRSTMVRVGLPSTPPRADPLSRCDHDHSASLAPRPSPTRKTCGPHQQANLGAQQRRAPVVERLQDVVKVVHTVMSTGDRSCSRRRSRIGTRRRHSTCSSCRSKRSDPTAKCSTATPGALRIEVRLRPADNAAVVHEDRLPVIVEVGKEAGDEELRGEVPARNEDRQHRDGGVTPAIAMHRAEVPGPESLAVTRPEEELSFHPQRWGARRPPATSTSVRMTDTNARYSADVPSADGSSAINRQYSTNTRATLTSGTFSRCAIFCSSTMTFLARSERSAGDSQRSK